MKPINLSKPPLYVAKAPVVEAIENLNRIFRTNSNALLAAGTNPADPDATYVNLLAQLLSLPQ